jgi:hypothetical protein
MQSPAAASNLPPLRSDHDHLRKTAGHGCLTTTRHNLHPDQQTIIDTAAVLSPSVRVTGARSM